MTAGNQVDEWLREGSPGMVQCRSNPGGPVYLRPMSRMDDVELSSAAMMAGHDRTEVVQAARNAALLVRRGVKKNRWRSYRRAMVAAALDANAVPQHLRKYATWLRFAAWLVPFPWGAIISAILWTVDKLIEEDRLPWLS